MVSLGCLVDYALYYTPPPPPPLPLPLPPIPLTPGVGIEKGISLHNLDSPQSHKIDRDSWTQGCIIS